MKNLYENGALLALVSDRISEREDISAQNALRVAFILAKFSVAILLAALTTTAFAEHGEAKVSDVDYTGMGTFSGTYRHASGPLADHPWFVFNASAGDVITIDINTKFNGGSHTWLYQAQDGCVEVGDYSVEGTLALLTKAGDGAISYKIKYTIRTTGQFAVQLDSFNGGDGAYTVTISGSTATTVLCPTKCSHFTVNLTNDGPLTCVKNSVTLTATGGPTGSTYLFTSGVQPGGLLNATTNVSLADPYSVTVTAPNGCSATAITIVSSNTTAPKVSVNPSSQAICQGQTASFTAQGTATYQWSSGQTSASISVSATGTYSLTGTGGNGCTSTVLVEVTGRSAKDCSNATPVAWVKSRPLPAGSATGSISLTVSPSGYAPNTPVSVSYSTPASTTAVYTGSTTQAGEILIAGLKAGSYGPFVVSINGGLASAPSNVVNLVDVAPDLTLTLYARPSTIYGAKPMTLVVDVVEVEGVASRGLITVRLTKDFRLSLEFDPNANSVNNRPVQNSDWSLDATSDEDYYILTSRRVVAAGELLSVGLTGSLRAGSTSGVMTVSGVLVGGSGGETKVTNNVDADKIDYFQQ